MNKHSIGVGLMIAGGALFVVGLAAGLQAVNNNGNVPAWYPQTLIDINTSLPLSLEYILLGTGAVLLYV